MKPLTLNISHLWVMIFPWELINDEMIIIWIWFPIRGSIYDLFHISFNQYQSCKSTDLSFAPFLDGCQWSRPNNERRKKSTFFYFVQSGEKLKKLETFLILTFSWEVKLNNNLRKLTWVISGRNPKKLHLIWEKSGTYFRFHKREWNREKRYCIFHFACRSQIKKVILMKFSSF